MATLPPIQVDILNTQAFLDFVEHADTVATKLVEVICEQERRDSWPELVAKTEAATRARIAADVQAMRDESARERWSNLSRGEISERVGQDVAYAAVLALLGGAK